MAVDEVEKYYEQQILWFQICPPNHTEFMEVKNRMIVKDLIDLLKQCEPDKDLVIYSNETKLKDYNLQGTYENEGQVELYIDEGEKL